MFLAAADGSVDLFNNPVITGGAATLGIGVIFLVLFATGKLPTPAERANLKESLAVERAEHQKELDTVRVNLRKDLDVLRTEFSQQIAHEREVLQHQLEQERLVFSKEIEARDKIIGDLNDYIKQLVSDIFAQQDSMQKDVVPPLALLAQQLPTILYVLQDLNRKNQQHGS